MDVIDLLLQFEGIVGTILGVLITLIATHWLQHCGTLYIFVNSWKVRFYRPTEMGDIVETDFAGAELDSIYFVELDMYNSSDMPKSLRNIYIEFVGENFVIQSKPEDSNAGVYAVPISIINIVPQSFVRLNLEGAIKKGDLARIYQGSTVYLIASDYKGREYREEIIKIKPEHIAAESGKEHDLSKR